MSVSKIIPDQWYTLNNSFGDSIICGDCAQQMIDDSNRGVLTGDEVVVLSQFELVTDAATEAYQCDMCCGQNEAYDELGEEVD